MAGAGGHGGSSTKMGTTDSPQGAVEGQRPGRVARAAGAGRAVGAVVLTAVVVLVGLVAVDLAATWWWAWELPTHSLASELGVFAGVILLLAPAAILAGIIGRRWWAPAVGAFLAGCVLWLGQSVLAAWRAQSPVNIGLAAGLHLVAAAIAASCGLLGARLPPERRGHAVAVAVGWTWLGGVVGAAFGLEWGAIRSSSVALASLLTAAGAFLGLSMALLAAWRMRGSGHRWTLGAAAVVWVIVAVGAAAAALLSQTRDVLSRAPAWLWAVVGTAAVSALLYVAAAVRGRRLARWAPVSLLPALGAVAALLAVTLLGLSALRQWPRYLRSADFGWHEEQDAEPLGSLYAALQVSPETTVYIELADDALRVASSPEGLAGAEPAPAERQPLAASYPAVKLPVPAHDLPEGCRQVLSSFRVFRFAAGEMTPEERLESLLCLMSSVSKWGEGADEWACVTQGPLEGLSLSLEMVEPLPFLIPGRVTALKVIAAPGREGGDTVGLAVQAMSGEVPVADVQRDGESVKAVLVVTDSAGRETASTRDTLENLGFT